MKIKGRKWFSGTCNQSVAATEEGRVYFLLLFEVGVGAR